MRKLNAKIDRRVFTEAPPAKDWDERFERAKSTVLGIINKGEKKISEVGTSIDNAVEKKDWKNKISGFFKEKFTKKDKNGQAVSSATNTEEAKEEEHQQEAEVKLIENDNHV